MYMISTKNLWFAQFLQGDVPDAWLKNLDGVVARALAENPERGQPAIMDVGAKIMGDVAFGKNCIVGHGALVVGPAIFGDNVVIGHCSEVARSIFGNDSRAAHFNYVGDSVLGSKVNLGAGAKLANLRFDHAVVRGRFEKLGAVLGDGVQIGCNAVLDPGVIVDAGVWFAGAHLPAPAAPHVYTRETIKKYFYGA